MEKFKKGFIYKIAISVGSAMLFKLLFFRLDTFWEPDLMIIPILILLLYLGNVEIDKRLEARFSWIENPKKRLILQSIACLIFSSITLFVFMAFLHNFKFGDGFFIDRRMREVFPIALILTFAIVAIYISNQFFNALKNSLLEVEKHKKESVNAQLQSLKNQVNPHFLFNNLSVLSSLVYINQDKAVDFINELSKVYRYVLDNKNIELVPLEDELIFLNHYIYLLKIRFDNSISFVINIHETQKTHYLIPMCLQMLVENAIQHNEASKAKPLNVSIYTKDNTLIVENTLQPRSDVVESSKMGLKNIQLRYAFFTDKKVEIRQNDTKFSVILPLILKK